MASTILKILSAAVLLFVSLIFGFIGKPTEMGLAILAGAIGLAFSDLDKFKRFSGAGFSAEMRDQIEAVVEKETEADPLQTSKEGLSVDGDDARKVMIALAHPSYTWRFVGGLKEDTGLSEEALENILEKLKNNGIAQKSIGKGNKPIWGLTGVGRLSVIPFKH